MAVVITGNGGWRDGGPTALMSVHGCLLLVMSVPLTHHSQILYLHLESMYQNMDLNLFWVSVR